MPAAGLMGVAMRILPLVRSRTGRRPGIPALVAVGLLISLLAVPAAAGNQATSGGAAVPKLAWTACGDEAPGFECATAQVPLDYDRPRGAKITLALTRLPASDPARRIGSIFFNPGGPGGSGVDFLQAVGPFLYSDEVRARFDLVSFDPRGVARSTPLQCFDTTDEALAALAPLPFPVTRAEERVWVQADRTWQRACAERGGPILNHMSTANVARDMDLLRRAVGDRKMTYVGYSYGTAIGSTYANMFPDKVRAVVIDGVIDPVSYTTGRGDQARTLPSDARLRSEQGAYDTLQAFLRLCDRGGPNCAFSDGNPKRRYDRLARRLLREPAQLPEGQGGTVPFTYADLVATTLGAMYDPTSWPDLAAFLQELDTLTSPARAAATLRGEGCASASGWPPTPPTSRCWRASPASGASAPSTPTIPRRGRGRPAGPTAATPTSAAPGSGSAASARNGRAMTATATSAPSTAAPPTPSWSSATSTTRRPATRTR
jgi:pimeloyl-ACP methyl ester carboxylesterase